MVAILLFIHLFVLYNSMPKGCLSKVRVFPLTELKNIYILCLRTLVLLYCAIPWVILCSYPF